LTDAETRHIKGDITIIAAGYENKGHDDGRDQVASLGQLLSSCTKQIIKKKCEINTISYK
jgi:hypothetical protein